VNSIDVYVDGAVLCSFDVNGNSMAPCSEAQLSPLSSTAGWGYGYAYGYGYGSDGSSSKLSYNLTLNTSEFDLGEYTVSLAVISSNTDAMISANKTISISSEGNADSVVEIPVSQLNGTYNADLGASLNLTFVGAATGSVVIESYSERPAGTNVFSIPGLGKYFKIELVGNSSALSSETEFRFYYSDSDVESANIKESTLSLYFWNGADWVSPLSTGVDTTNNYVWAKTNHFSIWSSFGSTVSNAAGGSSCYTDWSCTAWSECVDGQQVRTCTVPNTNCKYSSKPLELQSCGLKASNEKDVEGGIIAVNESSPSRTSLLTGAVIGALGNTGIGILIAIIILTLIAWVYVAMNKRKSSKKVIKKK